MSEFASKGGLSASLFSFARSLLGHRRGGVAMASIVACAGFGSICGSSLATTSSMTRVAYPELQKAGYSKSLSTGTLAAGGTLGVLIPPSIVLVIYALLAEENIQKLFVAAFIPAIIAILGYLVVIRILALSSQDKTALDQPTSWAQRGYLFRQVWVTIVIFVIVLGGIYTGAFSPTSAAAVGAAATGYVAWKRGRLCSNNFKQCLISAGKISTSIFFIILGSTFFNSFLSLAMVPQNLAEYLISSELNAWIILTMMLLIYLVLGTVMDSLAMIFLTVPIFYPIIIQLDFGVSADQVGIWFGILVLMSAEIGLITPPIGMNIFVIHFIAKDVPIATIYTGTLPFIYADLMRIALLVGFPSLSLFAVQWLY